MAQNLRVSMPVTRYAEEKNTNWRRLVENEPSRTRDSTHYVEFDRLFNYKSIFDYYWFEDSRSDKLTLLRVIFPEKSNLVSARQFLSTLADECIAVAAKFPNDEFKENLSDLVAKIIA